MWFRTWDLRCLPRADGTCVACHSQSAEMFVILLSFPPPLPWFQLKEFVLSQAEAYELRIGDQVFRRPGDPPLDQVLRKPRKKKRRKSRDEL
jgi:hypothetical protein